MQRGEKRLRHKEFVLPVVVGSCAFYLGKKVCSFPVAHTEGETGGSVGSSNCPPFAGH